MVTGSCRKILFSLPEGMDDSEAVVETKFELQTFANKFMVVNFHDIDLGNSNAPGKLEYPEYLEYALKIEFIVFQTGRNFKKIGRNIHIQTIDAFPGLSSCCFCLNSTVVFCRQRLKLHHENGWLLLVVNILSSHKK